MTSPKPAASSALLALATRCEKQKPSSTLDHLIACVAYSYDCIEIEDDSAGPRYYGYRGKQATELAPRMMRPYTTSLDAAVTLVPEGSEWSITNLYGVARAEADMNANAGPHYGEHKGGYMALALCAAALRARAAMAEDAGGPT